MDRLAKSLYIAMLSLALVASPLSAQQDSIVISEIVIEGARRISPATVRTYMSLNEGDGVTAASLNRVVSELFATDLFNDVVIELDGTRLLVTVDENPIINQVILEGNEVIDDDALLSILGIEPRRVYNRELALEGKARLTEVYRQSGRYAATIEPQIIELPDKRVDLVFVVNEGPLIKISRVKFIGNSAFSDITLRNVIASRADRWYLFLQSNDKFDPARLALDEQLLRQFYLQNGYANIDIIRSTGELLPDLSGFVLTFLIEEGQQYQVGEVSIASEIASVAPESLIDSVTINPTDVYDVRHLDETLLRVTNKLGELGYAFVNVAPDFVLNDNGTMDININVEQAERNFVERININNNDRTLDRVIRREMELVEGDSFNQLRLTRSVRNIRNLGYFSGVDSDVTPGSSPEQSVVDIFVQEQATGSFSIGVGYSTLDGASFQLGIEERNFLGTGNGLRANLATSGSQTNLRAGITRPYLFGRQLSGSADIFREDIEYTDVTTRQQGLDAGIGFRAANNFGHRFGYKLAETEVRDTSSNAASTSGDEGAQVISELEYRVSQDNRDSRFDPREGTFWRFSTAYAGLGGDVKYNRNTIRAQWLQPFYFKRFVFGLDAEAGIIEGQDTDTVSRANRFYLGGRKVRGFDTGGIGPRDRGDDTAVGGNKFYVGSLNIISDYGIDPDIGMRWTVFYDFGTVWEVDDPVGVVGADNDNLRTAIGYGLLWDTAIGPLTFFWADALDQETYDKTQTFQFTFGGRF